jgi:glutamate-ammonia-ligase adenylyltransferase
LRRAIAWTTAEGKAWDVDADLRPEGAAGALVRSLDAYRVYYERWAQTWERQALLRARLVAGDADLGARFLALIEPFVYRDPFPVADVRDVRVMKARIEHERVPSGDDAQFHLKLGKGTMSDVEWTAQLLQLQHGSGRPDIRTPSTRAALARLAAAGLLADDDADALLASYNFSDRARGYRYLLTGTPGDSLPVDRGDATRLGRMLGYREHPATELRDDYRRLTRRARAIVERVFYEHDDR